ncbi:unnamed protein product [Sphacelaria rigidula]
MAEGTNECIFVRVVLGRQIEYDIVLNDDNEGAKALADNPFSSGRSKDIDVRLLFVRDLVRAGEMRIVHVDSEWHHADIFTTPLPTTLFERHRRALMNIGDSE